MMGERRIIQRENHKNAEYSVSEHVENPSFCPTARAHTGRCCPLRRLIIHDRK
ncbi:hypothetical protein GA0061070_10599 [Kosakonia oryziphila]|uniref:Uncharacterized protein n=1 Tax=Kosakonia oryziphila TaxID=1005667 RepID=A0A1C4GAZ7_9ENTR|nr:hypothetical protein GA0061070_10599 [Kosakonia oryziphila]